MPTGSDCGEGSDFLSTFGAEEEMKNFSSSGEGWREAGIGSALYT